MLSVQTKLSHLNPFFTIKLVIHFLTLCVLTTQEGEGEGTLVLKLSVAATGNLARKVRTEDPRDSALASATILGHQSSLHILLQMDVDFLFSSQHCAKPEIKDQK